MQSNQQESSSFFERTLREAKDFALIAAYLYAVFVTIVLFKAAVLHSYGVHYVVWGTAFVKALVMAKFLLVGRALKVGTGRRNAPLIGLIAYRSLSLLLLLLVLTAIPEIATGLFHHRSLPSILHGLFATNVALLVSEVMILFLTLIPLVAFNILRETIGARCLQTMLFEGGEFELVERDPVRA